jgi:hypothetical protein
VDLQKARDWAGLSFKAIAILAIVLGSVWVYYVYSITDTAAPNVQLTIATEYRRHSDESRLLFIHVRSKNSGKVPVEVKPGNDDFVITVRRVSNNVGQDALYLEESPEFYKADLMKLFPDGYVLEPGVEHDQVLALVVPKDSIYAIKATLDLRGNDKVDQTVVARVE